MKDKIINILQNKNNINNFLLGILFSSPMLSFVIDINNIIPTIIVGVILLLSIINRKALMKKEHESVYIIVFLFLFILTVFFQFISGNQTQFFKERIGFFIVFGIGACIPLHIVIKVDDEEGLQITKILSSIIFIYALISPFIYNINFWTYNAAERMAISYYMLPLYISIIMMFFLEQEKHIKKFIIRCVIYVIVFFPYFEFLFLYLSRGAILAVIIVWILCFLQRKSLKQRITILLVLAILITFTSCFALNILKTTQNILNKFNVSFSFVNKNIKLLEEGKVGDGRDVIYNNAIKDIINQPIVGNGIGYFKAVYNTYPHNFILQLWSEGGIFFLLIFLIPIIKITFIMIFKEGQSDKYMFLLIFLFGASIIRLLLSFELWKDMFFWMYLYLALLLSYKDDKKRGKIHGKHSYTNV